MMPPQSHAHPGRAASVPRHKSVAHSFPRPHDLVPSRTSSLLAPAASLQVVDMGEFDLYRFLGAGGFGMVLLAKKHEKKKGKKE